MNSYRRKRDREWGWQKISDRSGRWLLRLLTLARVSCSCSAIDVSECSRLAPYFLTVDQRIALCREARTSAPAYCARKAHMAPGLSGPLVLDLCSGVVSDLPGVCVAEMSRSTAKSLAPELRVALCKDARSDAPAQCVEQSTKFKRQSQLVVDVCKGASSVAPAKCLDLLPRTVAYEAAVTLCSRAQTVGPAVCANFQSQHSNKLELTARLCQGASGQGPAECFRRSALISTLSTDDRVALCVGAESDAPARCAGEVRDRRVSPFEKIALCRGTSSTAPAACLASAPLSVPAGDRVALCMGAEDLNPAAPVACLKTVPQDLPATLAVALCRGASNSRAAQCAKAARHTIGDFEGLLTLCQDAPSTAPAHCAKAAFRVGAVKRLAAVLCAGSTSLVPALCFAAAPHQIPADLRVAACAGAQSTSPALCLKAAMPRGLRLDAGGAVCPLKSEAHSLPQRGLDYRLASRLCRHAIDDSPAECGRGAPLQMDDNDVEVLCAAKELPAGEATANCAAAALLIGVGSTNAAILCGGARSDMPAACFATSVPRIGDAGRIAICTGASSNAPARCANSLSVARSLTSAEMIKCKTAVPVPSKLHITDLGHEGEALFPYQTMQATLEIRDQWGGLIPADSLTVVRASVAVHGSNGVSVIANGRYNASSNGVVHFSHISFSGSGSLTLQFSIDRKDGVNVPLAAAQIVVAETEHGKIIRQCGRIFSLLGCPPEDQARQTNEETEKSKPWVPTEAVSVVTGGAGSAWYVLTCQQVLKENGVHIAYLPGHTSSLLAWVWYHPGIEVLETGAGLPTRDKPAWQTLGIERDACPREVRHAYYRQSLLWHPDRWVRHSMHSARAQEVFEIVSEAYAYMARRDRSDNQSHTAGVESKY